MQMISVVIVAASLCGYAAALTDQVEQPSPCQSHDSFAIWRPGLTLDRANVLTLDMHLALFVS